MGEGYSGHKVNHPWTQTDVDAIIEGLGDGTIDIIATDHPTIEMKRNWNTIWLPLFPDLRPPFLYPILI